MRDGWELQEQLLGAVGAAAAPPPRDRPLATLLADHSLGQRAAGINTHVALIDSIIVIAISCERRGGGAQGAR